MLDFGLPRFLPAPYLQHIPKSQQLAEKYPATQLVRPSRIPSTVWQPKVLISAAFTSPENPMLDISRVSLQITGVFWTAIRPSNMINVAAPVGDSRPGWIRWTPLSCRVLLWSP